MGVVTGKRLALAGITAMAAFAATPEVRAEDFLSALFGAFSGRAPASVAIPLRFAHEGDSMSGGQSDFRPRGAGGQAYCVRTCDGRYFPIGASDGQSRAAS